MEATARQSLRERGSLRGGETGAGTPTDHVRKAAEGSGAYNVYPSNANCKTTSGIIATAGTYSVRSSSTVPCRHRYGTPPFGAPKGPG